MYQGGKTPLIIAAMYGYLPVVEYLLENGADMEAKDQVSDVISLMWSHTYVTHEHMYLCECYQNGDTPLIYAAYNGHLPVVEFLLEKGADMEANTVSDVISSMWNHTYDVRHTWIYVCVNVSGWMDSIDMGCKGRSFSSGWISDGARSWNGGKG